MVVIFFRPHFRLKSISDSVVLGYGIGVYYISLKGGVLSVVVVVIVVLTILKT